MKDKPRTDRERKPCLLRRRMRAHDAGERVPVGDPDAGKPQLFRVECKLFGMGCAAQEGKIRGDAKLGKARHAKSPCRNQRGAAPSP